MRILLGIGGFGAAIFGPWWLPLVAMVLLSLRFRAIEVLFLGLFMDFFWLPSGTGWPMFLIASILIVWLFEPLRKELLLSSAS